MDTPPMPNQPTNTPPPPVPPTNPGWAAWGPPPPSGYPAAGWGAPPMNVPPPPRKKNHKPAIFALVFILVAALGIGTFFIVNAAGDDRTFADEWFPDDVSAALMVNTAPNGIQGLQALGFIHNFPRFAQQNGDSDDLLSTILDAAGDEESKTQYRTLIKPWVGKEFGFALREINGEPHWLMAVETKNESKARTSLSQLVNQRSGETFTVRNNVAYISDSEAAIPGEIDHKLSDNKNYSADVKKIQGRGAYAWAWADLQTLLKFAPTTSSTNTAVNGRVAMRLGLGSNYAEILTKVFGVSTAVDKPIGQKITELPADTVATFGATGLGSSLNAAFGAFSQAGGASINQWISEAEARTGLSIPDDIVSLVGDKTVIAMPANLHELGIITDANSEQANRTANTLMRLIDPNSQIAVNSTADGTVLASSQEYANALATKGSLGQQERFRTAVPDAAKSSVIAYGDIERLAPISQTRMSDDARAIKAIGLTAYTDSTGGTMRIRLVVGKP